MTDTDRRVRLLRLELRVRDLRYRYIASIKRLRDANWQAQRR